MGEIFFGMNGKGHRSIEGHDNETPLRLNYANLKSVIDWFKVD